MIIKNIEYKKISKIKNKEYIYKKKNIYIYIIYIYNIENKKYIYKEKTWKALKVISNI